jgi:hypothetical protein
MQKQDIANSAVLTWLREQSNLIWENTIEKGLWRRILKVVVATTTANAIMLIPQLEPVIGKASYLAGLLLSPRLIFCVPDFFRRYCDSLWSPRKTLWTDG